MAKRKAKPKKCKSKAKTTGKRCKKNVVPGYNVCNTHGGKTPRGFDSVHTTHGRYIKDTPDRLFDRFEEAINDPQLVDLKAEIALIDTRIGEMLSKLDTERYGSIWVEVDNARAGIERAMTSGKVDELIDAYNYLKDVINEGYNDQITWSILAKMMEQRRKLIESQHKLQTDADKLITIEDLTHSVMRLSAIIREHVTDRKTLAAINTDIREFINAN